MTAKRPKTLLIINPAAGTDNKEGLARRIAEAMNANSDVTVAYTSGRGDATRLAHEAIAEGYATVLAAGGDGTVNETAAALCGSHVALGIIPCGSGNGLARHIGLSTSVDRAIEAACRGNAIDMDHGMFNGRPFFCTCGVGFDAEVSDAFAQEGRRGFITYIRNTVNLWTHYESAEYDIIVDGRQWRQKAMLLTVANASQYGNNAYIAPDASVTDGMLDLVIVRPGNMLETALVGFDLMTRRIGHNVLVDTIRVSRVRIVRPDAGTAHIDGEPVQAPAAIDIECRPRGLRVIIP